MVNRTGSVSAPGGTPTTADIDVSRGSSGACSKYAPSVSIGSTARWTKTGPIACDRNVAEVITPKLGAQPRTPHQRSASSLVLASDNVYVAPPGTTSSTAS